MNSSKDDLNSKTNEKRKEVVMKNKKKGFWVILSIVMIVNFAVFGLDLLNPMPQGVEYEEGVLRVWATWGDNQDNLQPLFDRFTQATGIPVKVATGFKSDQIEKALASETPPDVVILSNNVLVSTLYQQGLIEPLGTWIDRLSIDMDDIYRRTLEGN